MPLPDSQAFTIIPTADVPALRRFYEGVLGFSPIVLIDEAVATYRASGGTRFSLSRSGGRASGGHTQLMFLVDDIEATVGQLRERGVTFEEYETPRTEDGIARMPAGRAAWFLDPDGNVLAVLQPDGPM